jgi:hypothetical protein
VRLLERFRQAVVEPRVLDVEEADILMVDLVKDSVRESTADLRIIVELLRNLVLSVLQVMQIQDGDLVKVGGHGSRSWRTSKNVIAGYERG